MSEKGLTGLSNLGNTCFMNATLQCLSHTDELYKIISNDKNNQVSNEWCNLRNLMWSKNCIISPKRFLFSIHQYARKKNRVIFTGYAQNDIPEFILFIFECFHESIKREVNISIEGISKTPDDKIAALCYDSIKKNFENDYSEIISTFYGIHIAQIFNTDNSILNRHAEPFFILDLPIPNKINPTLKECFDLYTSFDELNGENQYFNDKSKTKIDAKRQIQFFKFPDILIITLKRFDNSLRKNNSLISFPLDNFDLSSYVIGYNAKQYIYELYGICNHSGSIKGGHYTAFVKTNQNNWYHFDDTNVHKITKLEQLQTPKAYCFFYRKKNK